MERKIGQEEINNIIYMLRQEEKKYKEIANILKNEYGICLKSETIKKKYYQIKGYKRKHDAKLDDIDFIIYELREQGNAYREISKILETRGIKLSRQGVDNRCKKIYSILGKEEPTDLRIARLESIEGLQSKIYLLRQERLAYQQIAKQLQEDGITINSSEVSQICKKIYAQKKRNRTNSKIKYSRSKTAKR